MLVLNGKKFARNDKEFISSLFEGKSTCVGYYKVNKRSISLMDQHKNKIGAIANRVLATATKLDNNKYWYSYATPALVGKYESYAKEQADIHAAMKMLEP